MFKGNCERWSCSYWPLLACWATYMDIHSSGGGIYSTVCCVHQAHVDWLASFFSDRLSAMMHCGTTTVEAKTGYEFDLKSEVKMLRVIERVRKEHPISVSVTYCGAHAVPKRVSYFSVKLLLSCVAHVCSSILCCIMWQCTALLHHSHMHTEYLCYSSYLVLRYYTFLQR